MRTGIFVGSFNPFTVGHDSVVTRALPLFDRLVIGVVGDQVHKPDMPSAEERVRAIAELYKDEPAIEVKPYYGLAVDFAKAENAHFIVKGVRSVKDFEYEREQADINWRLSYSIQNRNIRPFHRVWSANYSTSESMSRHFFRNEKINNTTS